MKRYNMWLLKLLFKDSIRVNMENYQYLLLHNPSSSLLKFVEKHLVDENDNTISVEEMKLKIEKLKNNGEIVVYVILNLKWKRGDVKKPVPMIVIKNCFQKTPE